MIYTCFGGGYSLQSQELNELQEQIANQMSLMNEFMGKWSIAHDSDPLTFSNILPVATNTNIVGYINSGWYLFEYNNFHHFVLLPNISYPTQEYPEIYLKDNIKARNTTFTNNNWDILDDNNSDTLNENGNSRIQTFYSVEYIAPPPPVGGTEFWVATQRTTDPAAFSTNTDFYPRPEQMGNVNYYEYIKPMVIIADCISNGGWTASTAQQFINGELGCTARFPSITTSLNEITEGKRSVWLKRIDNGPLFRNAGDRYADGRFKPWAAVQGAELKEDIIEWVEALRDAGGIPDYVVLDAPPGDGNKFSSWDAGFTFTINNITTDPLASAPWYSSRSFDDLYSTGNPTDMSFDGLYSGTSTYHPQLNTQYLYWNIAVSGIQTAFLDEFVYKTIIEYWGGVSKFTNYNSIISSMGSSIYDHNGHPLLSASYVGDALCPVLYAGWKWPDAYGVDALDHSQIIRNNYGRATVPFALNTWNQLLLLIQKIRGVKREAPPNTPIRPWINSPTWGGDDTYNPKWIQQPLLYNESIKHFALIGSEMFNYFNLVAENTNTTNLNKLESILEEINLLTGGFRLHPLNTEKISFLTNYIISGSPIDDGTYIWRVTPKPNFSLVDASNNIIPLDPDGGAWIFTTTSTPPTIEAAILDSSSLAQATSIFNFGFRVSYNIGTQSSTDQNGLGESRRVGAYGIDRSSFTWERFITLNEEDSYNPSSGGLNPWSLKKWYQWGCRNFQLHCPFGKVAGDKLQKAVYEVDQFITARDGLIINGVIQNTPCPWLTNDFVSVIKALTTGTQGTLSDSTWNSWTIGSNAWFDPTSPIDMMCYIGAMANPDSAPETEGYSEYINRWQALFDTGGAGGIRLQESVAPFIEANCKIMFDASVISPGPTPGQNVPLIKINEATQIGWWTFWINTEQLIGKSRMYVEAHPFKTGTPADPSSFVASDNPYLGYNIIADDDWSYSKCCPYTLGHTGPHATSEMGNIEFWRSIWQTDDQTLTPLIATITNQDQVETLERYSFLNSLPNSQVVPVTINSSTTELRLRVATCCEPTHNYYWSDIYASLIAFHLLEKQSIRGEPLPEFNITKSGIFVPATLLQILPTSYPNDPRYLQQFGSRFLSASSFILYLATIITSPAIPAAFITLRNTFDFRTQNTLSTAPFTGVLTHIELNNWQTLLQNLANSPGNSFNMAVYSKIYNQLKNTNEYQSETGGPNEIGPWMMQNKAYFDWRHTRNYTYTAVQSNYSYNTEWVDNCPAIRELYVFGLQDTDQAIFLNESGGKNLAWQLNIVRRARAINNTTATPGIQTDAVGRAIDIAETRLNTILTHIADNRYPIARDPYWGYDCNPNIDVSTSNIGTGSYLGDSWGTEAIIWMLKYYEYKLNLTPAGQLIITKLKAALRHQVERYILNWTEKRAWYTKGSIGSFTGRPNTNQWQDPASSLVNTCLYLGDSRLKHQYEIGVGLVMEALLLCGNNYPEGIAYALQSVQSLLQAVYHMQQAGDHRLDDLPFVKNIWKWMLDMNLPGNYVVNHSDSRNHTIPSWEIDSPTNTTAMSVIVANTDISKESVKYLYEGNAWESEIQIKHSLNSFNTVVPPTPPFANFAVYPGLDPSIPTLPQQQILWRTGRNKPRAIANTTGSAHFAIVIKGGTELDGHYHRDLGNVAIYCGKRIVLMDCGSAEYSQQDYRINFGLVSGHNIMQLHGRKLAEDQDYGNYRGPIAAPVTVNTLNNTTGDITLNTTSCYENTSYGIKPALVSSVTRRVQWDRDPIIVNNDLVVTIDDTCEFTVSGIPGTPVGASAEHYRFHTGCPGSGTITIVGNNSNAVTATWLDTDGTVAGVTNTMVFSVPGDTNRMLHVKAVNKYDKTKPRLEGSDLETDLIFAGNYIHKAIIITPLISTNSLALRTVITVPWDDNKG